MYKTPTARMPTQKQYMTMLLHPYSKDTSETNVNNSRLIIAVHTSFKNDVVHVVQLGHSEHFTSALTPLVDSQLK